VRCERSSCCTVQVSENPLHYLDATDLCGCVVRSCNDACGTDFAEHVIYDHSVEVLSVCGRCYDESKVCGDCIYSII